MSERDGENRIPERAVVCVAGGCIHKKDLFHLMASILFVIYTHRYIP